MKYEDPEMQVIELMARDVFMTASGGNISSGTGGGGGFEDDDEPGDF